MNTKTIRLGDKAHDCEQNAIPTCSLGHDYSMFAKWAYAKFVTRHHDEVSGACWRIWLPMLLRDEPVATRQRGAYTSQMMPADVKPRWKISSPKSRSLVGVERGLASRRASMTCVVVDSRGRMANRTGDPALVSEAIARSGTSTFSSARRFISRVPRPGTRLHRVGGRRPRIRVPRGCGLTVMPG